MSERGMDLLKEWASREGRGEVYGGFDAGGGGFCDVTKRSNFVVLFSCPRFFLLFFCPVSFWFGWLVLLSSMPALSLSCLLSVSLLPFLFCFSDAH